MQEGQLGYAWDDVDPHTVLETMVADAARSDRRIWACLGDFVKAFPYTLRKDLLVTLHDEHGFKDGVFA